MTIGRAVLCVLVLAACGDEGDVWLGNPDVLTDQSGAVFGWSCDADRCELERIEGSPPLPDCGPKLKPGYSYTWGSLMTIDAMCARPGESGWFGLAGWSRVVVCETNDDCPYIVGGQEPTSYVCTAGLCTDRGWSGFGDVLPDRGFMTELCLGDTPRFELQPFAPPPELAAAIVAACPDAEGPCVDVPAGCHDPRP